MIFNRAQPVVWDCLIVGLLLLGLFNCWDILVHHIQSLTNVAVATIACNLLQGKNDIWAVTLLWHPDLLFTVGLKDQKALLAACLLLFLLFIINFKNGNQVVYCLLFFCLLSKSESRLIKSPVCMCVCAPTCRCLRCYTIGTDCL
jgi:hypothetical protein